MMDTKCRFNMEAVRSSVRVVVTFVAAAYVFGGSWVLIYFALWGKDIKSENFTSAKDIFLMVLPIATSVITYWFASRSAKTENDRKGNENDGDNSGNPD